MKLCKTVQKIKFQSSSILPPACVRRTSGKEETGTVEGLWAATVCAGRAVPPWAKAEPGRAGRPPAGAQRPRPGLWRGSVQRHSWCSGFWIADCPWLWLTSPEHPAWSGRMSPPTWGRVKVKAELRPGPPDLLFFFFVLLKPISLLLQNVSIIKRR